MKSDPRPTWRLAPAWRWMLLAGALALAAHAGAEQTDSAPPAPAAAEEGADAPPKCVHGCLRWGESCNVDPRGVYKCRRRCEQFGEICE